MANQFETKVIWPLLNLAIFKNSQNIMFNTFGTQLCMK